MYSLTELGFDALTPTDGVDRALIARVSAEYGERFDVLAEDQDRSTVSLAGTLRDSRPAVGDFVELNAERNRIDRVLPSRTAVIRQSAGQQTRAQIIAANIDIVFVVTSMNDEFNESRLERYLAVAWESGATPVVLLNKSDLAEDPEHFVDRASRCAFGVDVVALTALDGAESLDAYTGVGRTFVLVGSSGVGKSTIANALIGMDALPTGAIREDDDEGRHTTTRRDLIVLSGERGVLIDTPGMRELQLGDASDGLSVTFADIEELGARCRFRNCQHEGEPGCAIDEALDSGELDARRLANYQKLQRELAYHDRKRDAAASRAESRRWAKVVRTANKEAW